MTLVTRIAKAQAMNMEAGRARVCEIYNAGWIRRSRHRFQKYKDNGFVIARCRCGVWKLISANPRLSQGDTGD